MYNTIHDGIRMRLLALTLLFLSTSTQASPQAISNCLSATKDYFRAEITLAQAELKGDWTSVPVLAEQAEMKYTFLSRICNRMNRNRHTVEIFTSDSELQKLSKQLDRVWDALEIDNA